MGCYVALRVALLMRLVACFKRQREWPISLLTVSLVLTQVRHLPSGYWAMNLDRAWIVRFWSCTFWCLKTRRIGSVLQFTPQPCCHKLQTPAQTIMRQTELNKEQRRHAAVTVPPVDHNTGGCRYFQEQFQAGMDCLRSSVRPWNWAVSNSAHLPLEKQLTSTPCSSFPWISITGDWWTNLPF